MKKMITILLCLSLLMVVSGSFAESSDLVPEFTIGAKVIPDSEAQRFVTNLRMGFNIGNSFDANNCSWLSNELDYESAWCGAKITTRLLDTLKEAGYKTIRLPVSWHDHLTDKENYIISERWLNRVQQVIDWAIERDFYVIVNIHHDNSLNYLYPSVKLEEQSKKYITSIWTQLSERFINYDEHLLFESMNEPRLVGHPNEWSISNSQEVLAAIAVINHLNQTFVDTVRASGGNNATRYLLCPGYDASPEGCLHPSFVVPNDPVETNDHRIIIGVHAYTPYSFALQMPGTDTWSIDNNSDKSNVATFMQKLYDKYVSKGQPVIISEFGALDKKGNIQARTEFTAYYVASARVRGMTCIYWDNNATTGTGEKFGIINRLNCNWQFPSIAEAMNRYADPME